MAVFSEEPGEVFFCYKKNLRQRKLVQIELWQCLQNEIRLYFSVVQGSLSARIRIYYSKIDICLNNILYIHLCDYI